MNKKVQLEKQFNESVRKNWVIRIKTNNPDGDSYDGIVLKNSKDFIVIREFQNFEADGIIIFPKKRIVGIRNGGLEKSYNKVCRFNRTNKKTKNYKGFLSLNSIKEVLIFIKKVREWPIIERITGRRTALYIGPLTEVEDDFFKIYCYDANGKWEGVYKLKLEQVFKIEMSSKYGNRFNKYMSATTKGKNGKRKV